MCRDGWAFAKEPCRWKIGNSLHERTAKALIDEPAPAFMLDLARKDIGLALTAAAAAKVPMSTGGVAREFYNIASANGHGGEDWSTGSSVL